MKYLITAAALCVATPALAQDKMTLLLDWFINPDHGPIIVAEELGYFADQDLEVEIIDSGCCGLAGAFGYEAGNYDISMTMGEIGLFPAVRGASSDTLIVASGTSCRHQIRDGAGREAVHVARVLEKALGNK